MAHKKQRSGGREVRVDETTSSIPCSICLSNSKIAHMGEAGNKKRKVLYERKWEG